MPSKTADAFRAAVRFGNFPLADRLLIQLRQEFESAWAVSGPSEHQVMARQVLELLEWARQSALVRRSHLHRKLAQVRLGGAYRFPASTTRARLEIEG
jgi:hypothetical protein